MIFKIGISKNKPRRRGGPLTGVEQQQPPARPGAEKNAGAVQHLPPPGTAVITDIHELASLELSTHNQIIHMLAGLGDAPPAVITRDLDIYAIADDELSHTESLSLHRILALVNRVRPSGDSIHHQVTRAVFDSYRESRQDTNIREETRETSKNVETILKKAIDNKATDIHIMIKRDECYIFERVYGQLREVSHFNARQGEKMINALWNLYVQSTYSGADVAKDGRFEFRHSGRNWLCRVSYVYSKVNKERSVAIRLRDMQRVPDIGSLGYSEKQLYLIERATMTKGMILMIGSVNSGKSTTQTAIMKSRGRDKKNFELSDQIEVIIDNFTQVQIPIEGSAEKIAEDRERLRRVSTRHDVNFIAINEIRDRETAAMASAMLLQGTTAISSIHGSNWADALNRMMSPTDLGIPADILFSESFLSLIITQTLIGILCERCRLETCPLSGYQDYFTRCFGAAAMTGVRFRNSTGCKHCRHSGITGLTLAAEVVPVNESNRRLLKDTTDTQTMREWLHRHRIENIHEHAFNRTIDGRVDPLMVEEKIGPFNRFNLFERYLGDDEPLA